MKNNNYQSFGGYKAKTTAPTCRSNSPYLYMACFPRLRLARSFGLSPHHLFLTGF